MVSKKTAAALGGDFDEEALQDISSQIEKNGVVRLESPASIPFGKESTFINIRVWAHNDTILAMLKKSQEKGGFSVAPSPNGYYAWAEAFVPPCN